MANIIATPELPFIYLYRERDKGGAKNGHSLPQIFDGIDMLTPYIEVRKVKFFDVDADVHI